MITIRLINIPPIVDKYMWFYFRPHWDVNYEVIVTHVTTDVVIFGFSDVSHVTKGLVRSRLHQMTSSPLLVWGKSQGLWLYENTPII